MVVPAQMASASVVRERTAEWLAAQGWPENELHDVVMAVNEAVANAVDHAYAGRAPGDVSVAMGQVVEPGARRAVVSVVDDGRWRAPRADRYRGHGLTVMHGVMDSVQIAHGEAGTRVTMISAPVPIASEDRAAIGEGEGPASPPPAAPGPEAGGRQPSGAA